MYVYVSMYGSMYVCMYAHIHVCGCVCVCRYCTDTSLEAGVVFGALSLPVMIIDVIMGVAEAEDLLVMFTHTHNLSTVSSVA